MIKFTEKEYPLFVRADVLFGGIMILFLHFFLLYFFSMENYFVTYVVFVIFIFILTYLMERERTGWK